jgi:DNA (cytosine-5)-methyltransferase 1
MGDISDPAFAVRATKVSTVAMSIAENQRGEVLESSTAGTLITSGGKPGTGYPAVRHETVVRRLTEMECERLQGYPDGWTDGQTASARYRQLGNSVAVPCVEWIARRLVQIDEGTAS